MLELRDIGFSYGDRPLFSGVNCAIGEDERVAVLGPSGAGKTTLCRVIAGYLTPDRGEVLLDGAPAPLRGRDPIQLIGQNPAAVIDERRRLGDTLAEATSALDRWRTLGEFGGKGEAAPAAIVRLLEALGIRPGWLHRFPHELSGGELQRFCIARALLATPRFLVADEITTMLDTVSAARIWAVIRAYLKERRAGLIFVSHVPALVSRLATRTLPLSQGH